MSCINRQEMESRPVMLGLIQASASPDPDENIRKMVCKVSEAISAGAQIICLPELYRTQYFPQYIGRDTGLFKETIPGESTRVFSDLAKQHEVVIIVPIYEYSKTGQHRNAAVIIDIDGTVSPPYYKVHVPQDPSFFEKGYFAEGNEFRVVDTRFGKIAVLICYDQWFPEAARAVALAGAEIIFYPTAIGDILDASPVEGEWQNSWETIQRSHAIANSVHVAAVNRVGTEDRIRFFGGSFVADAFGSILVRAGSEEEILLTTIDLSMNKFISDSWGFIRNRRPETYRSLCTPIRRDGPECVSSALGDTPRNRGFHMPAEWEHHEAV
ncbi:MAG TPA: nitrilase-related carbon-nitrogen hydrolase, partial [Methanospirillum sp.]|uniref:nitrilase-related carbon-nitrogen hydrolase n=1 Tax=Methanospirillum sp. TaxID=45200 RepID=UPI002CB7CE1D